MKSDAAANATSSDQCELLPPDINSECPAEFLENSGDSSERFRQLIEDLLAAKQVIANLTQPSGASAIAEEKTGPVVNSAIDGPIARLVDEIIDRLQLAPLIHRENRTNMNGKPVRYTPAQTVVNYTSGFAEKLLCTGPIANLGDGCGFNCSFCYYLASLSAIQARKKQEGAGTKIMAPGQAVLRRKDAIRVAITNLHDSRGNLRPETQRHHVLFSSTSVDPAANMELARETAALCRVLLDLTVWEIRLLSKSSLLPKIHELIPEQHRHRMIYGVSTGTLDDKLASTFEQGTALVSKRGASIRRLQDLGARTFGMICPSLPVEDADAFSKEMCAFLRVDRMEEVWAEVLNVRGDSMKQTCAALDAGGFKAESAALGRVSKDKNAWEEYSRETFLAHTRHVPKGKLRFLQYVGSAAEAPWWRDQKANGAVLLGEFA